MEWGWLILTVLVFVARIFDVSMGTVRIIFISKGYSWVAAFIGFFEVLIWIITISQLIQNLSSFFNYIGFAAGFATGTYIGVVIEKKLSLGQVLMRIITSNEADDLIEYLKSKKFYITYVDAKGARGDVKIILMLIYRSELNKIIESIKEFNPNIFYSVEDLRMVSGESFSKGNPMLKRINFLNQFSAKKK